MKLQTTNYKLLTKKGFTIIELLAVTSVILLLGTILLASTREPTKKIDVRRAAQIVSADLRRAQGLALSAESITCSGGTLVPYYGFRIQEAASGLGSYTLFADCDKDYTYNDSDDVVVGEEIVQNVQISETTPASGGSTFLKVVYIPPAPTVAVSGTTYSHPDVGTFSIQLCHITNGTLCETVSGNTRGNIEVE